MERMRMAIKWERIQPGDVLYSTVKRGMGNTRMKRTHVITWTVLSIDHEAGTARVKKNGAEKTVRARTLTKLRRSEPKVHERGRG